MPKTAPLTVIVIGLGYVGLPLAVRSREKGYSVIGFDIDQSKLAALKRGEHTLRDPYLDEQFARHPIRLTHTETAIRGADIYVICVPTPVDHLKHPDLRPVIAASEIAARSAKKGALIILESTVNPGVSEEIILPILEKHGFTVGTDIHLAHCPERINPGDRRWNVTNIPRVVGSLDPRGLKLALAYYHSIVDADIRPMRSIREAEAVKILENSFRNINIAFVNEIAKSFDRLGIDIKDVIDGAATKPFSFLAHYPSCGVGGHCIPVDPHYLVERAKASGFNHHFLKLAMETNDSMPEYTVERLQDALNDCRLPMKGTRIALLGLSYKADIADMRESPSLVILEHLRKHHCTISTFDPHVPKLSTAASLAGALKGAAAVVLATNHRAFVDELTPALLRKHKVRVVIDGKNCLDKAAFEKAGIIYRGIGR